MTQKLAPTGWHVFATLVSFSACASRSLQLVFTTFLRTFPHFLGIKTLLGSATVTSGICVFVFVYLCICVFVYLCIWVSDTWDPHGSPGRTQLQ